MVIMMVVGHRRRAVGMALRAAGQILFVGGHLFGPDRVSVESPFGHGNDQGVGVAIATQIAGGLCVGTADLVENDNLYAAMGLLRQ
jgi:hypothetical protein